jgi:hypothetical protein
MFLWMAPSITNESPGYQTTPGAANSKCLALLPRSHVTVVNWEPNKRLAPPQHCQKCVLPHLRPPRAVFLWMASSLTKESPAAASSARASDRAALRERDRKGTDKGQTMVVRKKYTLALCTSATTTQQPAQHALQTEQDDKACRAHTMYVMSRPWESPAPKPTCCCPGPAACCHRRAVPALLLPFSSSFLSVPFCSTPRTPPHPCHLRTCCCPAPAVRCHRRAEGETGPRSTPVCVCGPAQARPVQQVGQGGVVSGVTITSGMGRCGTWICQGVQCVLSVTCTFSCAGNAKCSCASLL